MPPIPQRERIESGAYRIVEDTDLIRLPYTNDLTQAGILFACRALGTGLITASNLDLDPLRRTIADIAAELSFRRWLGHFGVPYRLFHATPFSQPHKEGVLVNGRQCHLINCLVPSKVNAMQDGSDLAGMLSAPACLAETDMHSDHLGHNDLLVFSFTGSLPDVSWQERRHGDPVEYPQVLIYLLPKSWQTFMREQERRSERFTLTSQEALELDVGGTSNERGFLSETVHLLPGQPFDVGPGFAQIAYLSTRQAPTKGISIQKDLGRSHQITPERWGNLWIEGSAILLAGYIPVGEFRRHARRLHHPGSPWNNLSWPSSGMALPVRELLPLSRFFTK